MKTVKGKIPVFVDGSFENGMDVFKALALGADAVCVGRVLMPPIQQQGAEGCRQTLQDITGELAGARWPAPALGTPGTSTLSLLWVNGKRL